MKKHTISAVGIWFYSQDTKRHLYLMRNDKKYQGHWGLPGGKVEDNESLIEAIERDLTCLLLSCFKSPATGP